MIRTSDLISDFDREYGREPYDTWLGGSRLPPVSLEGVPQIPDSAARKYDRQKTVNGKLAALVARTIEAAKREIHARHLMHQLAALEQREEAV